MFSGPVIYVDETNIFARGSVDGRQFVVYSMTMKAKDDLAMILPLPVPKNTADVAVKFINLEKYPDFFSDLQRGFPVARGSGGTHSAGAIAGAAKAPLKVVEVGSFEASYVPSIPDFKRLDERFRLPVATWNQLPQYQFKHFGFAVFKLKPGDKRIHPMAFEFPRADAKQLFFPTVHVHDGKVHPTARFDHVLYCQENAGESLNLLHQWQESTALARDFVDLDKAENIIAGDRHCHMRRMTGNLRNEDTVVCIEVRGEGRGARGRAKRRLTAFWISSSLRSSYPRP